MGHDAHHSFGAARIRWAVSEPASSDQRVGKHGWFVITYTQGNMANNHSEIEKRLWASADELRANSKLKSSEYSVPVLGLIFLRYADHKFAIAEKELAGKGSGRRGIGKEDYQAKGVMYLPPQARFSKLLNLPEGENIGKAINEAMKAVEAENEDLKGVFPRPTTRSRTLRSFPC